MGKVSWKKAIPLEHRVQEIITQQEINGFEFNSQRARFYVHALGEKCSILYNLVKPILKAKVIQPGTEVSKPFIRTGDVSKRAKDYLGEQIEYLAGPFTPVAFEIPRLSQRKQIQQILLRLGWKPIHFTKNGSPQMTVNGEPCKSLDRITGVGGDLALWYKYKHRQSQIKGLLGKVRKDGRIGAGANTIGTNTGRMRHRNVVNIPKAEDGVLFGKEMRSLFTCRYKQGWRLLGGDAKGLEARMEAHYTFKYDDGEYAKELLGGDVHSKNAEVFGCTRSIAKGGKYAITYGAGVPKFSETVGVSQSKGKVLYDAFWKHNVALRKLTEDCQRESLKGYLVGLDGRKVRMRKFTSPARSVKIGGVEYPNPRNIAYTKAVNTLFQSAGAIVMKYAMCIFDYGIQEVGLQNKVLKVGDFHDESQYEFLYSKELEEEVKSLYIYSIKEAGRMLKLNIPLDADVKVGISWDKTH